MRVCSGGKQRNGTPEEKDGKMERNMLLEYGSLQAFTWRFRIKTAYCTSRTCNTKTEIAEENGFRMNKICSTSLGMKPNRKLPQEGSIRALYLYDRLPTVSNRTFL